MSIYHVDVHLFMHRCPANPAPHVAQSNRAVLGVVDGGPCRAPITVRGQILPCGRIAVHDKQCPACKTQVIIVNTRITDLGFQGAAREVAAGFDDEVPW